jgi:uncharacterized protein (PEP-CTERM system associated)
MRPQALAALALLGAQAAPAMAAEWRFTPELLLRETYSDNYTLAPSGFEQSGFVTEVAPGFTLTGKGRRSEFHANYQLRGVNYSGGQGHNNFQNYLNADGRAELMDDFMFIEGNANINNVSTSAFGPQALDSTYATNNRTEVRSYTISPFIKKRLSSLAQGELRYTHQGVSSDTAGFSNYTGDRLNANLSSGEAYRTLGWDLAGWTQQSRYSGDLNSVRSDYINGTLRYRLTDTFSLTGSTGYERYTYPNVGDAASGASWSVGFDWRPSPRTSVTATGGQRFYGNAYSFNGTHRSRYTTWNINYNEEITTQQQQFAESGSVSTSSFLNQAFLVNIPDPVARQQAVDAFIRATNLPATLATGNLGLSNRFFLQKRLQASMAYTMGRSTALVSAYDTLRRPRSGADENSGFVGNLFFSDQTRQRGVSGLYSLRLSPLSTMNLNAQYYRTASLLTNIADDNKLVTLGVSHQFSPHTTGTVELRRYQGTFTQSGTDFRENAISAYLYMRL